MMKKNLSSILFYLLSLSLWGEESLPVFVSILPQKYFVEKIGAGFVSVSVLVKPGYDAHSYEPKPRQMKELSSAKIYFALGFPFETIWLPRFQSINPNMLIVPTDAGINKIKSADHHHEQGNTEEEVLDPHIWLSPALVRSQAIVIREALMKADPAHKNEYEANYKKFDDELILLDKEIKVILSPGTTKNRIFMVYHPAWGYFARDYGLTQIPIEQEGKEPKPAYLEQLINEARKQQIKAIFIQPEFSTKMAQTLASAIGGKVILADSMTGDWAENLKTVAKELKTAMQE
jgi:zinc transport system substrate-binding protein